MLNTKFESFDETVIPPFKVYNIILLHGLFGNLSNWEKVQKEFSPAHNVLIPKLPLFDGAVSADRLNGLVYYLDNYIEAKDLDKVVLVGNSLGGHLALLYSLKYPEKVDRLILTGSSGLYENSFNGSFPKIKDYNYISQRVKDIFFKKDVVTEALVKEVYQTVQNPLKALAAIRLAREVQKRNLSALLYTINIPVLLIWGLQDQVTPPEVGLNFHEKLPGSELKYIDECGHAPMIEQPELFNEYLKDFLER